MKPGSRWMGLALWLLLGRIVPAEPVALIELHRNDSQGNYAGPAALNSVIDVEGVATVGSAEFGSGYLEAYLQDATGGVMIYAAQALLPFERGDSLRITGKIRQYKGMTEIEATAIELLKTACVLPQPRLLHCREIAAAYDPDFSEPNEGRLIRLDNVQMAGVWPGTVFLSDSTGQCALYVDRDIDLDESVFDPGTYNITGILKQYDSSAPWWDGYEIAPRNRADIILPEVYLLSLPEISAIQTDGFSIGFQANREGMGQLIYTNIEGNESFTLENSLSAANHIFHLTNLTPASIYRLTPGLIYQAATYTFGDSWGIPSSLASSGECRIYFNLEVDTTLKSGQAAHGAADLGAVIGERIDQARFSIDLAIYSFSYPPLAEDLIAARDRGVVVRVVYTNRSEQTGISRLKEAGIPVLTNRNTANEGEEIMHDKFLIVDYRDKSSDRDDWVMTGSANFTEDQLYRDAENIVWIQDQALAAVYTREFEEMWGGSDDWPRPDSSRFGARKTANTPTRVQLPEGLCELYMGPEDQPITAIEQAIAGADHSVYFSIFAFTHRNIAEALRERLGTCPGLIVRGIFDPNMDANSMYFPMSGQGQNGWNPPADVRAAAGSGLYHHKYMIIDAEYPESDPLVVTGSANWSYSVANENNENLLILHSAHAANQYLQEFAQRYREAGGEGGFAGLEEPSPVAGLRPFTFEVYPQPASAQLYLRLNPRLTGPVKLTLYDLLGRKIADYPLTTGTGEMKLDISNRSLFPCGIYLMRLETPETILSRRILILR